MMKMMMTTTRVTVSFVLLSILCRVSVADERCTQTGPCTCVGPQGRVDLKALSRSDFLPRFPDTRDRGGSQFYYSYNPCLDFTEGGCRSVAVCQTDLGAQSYSLGDQRSATFIYDDVSKLNQICYSYLGADGVNRSACVTLKCDHSVEGQLDFEGEVAQSNAYRMTLTSMYACANDTTTPAPTHSTTPHSTPPSTLPTPTFPPSIDHDLKSIQKTIAILLVVVILQLLVTAATLVVLMLRRKSRQGGEKSRLIN